MHALACSTRAGPRLLLRWTPHDWSSGANPRHTRGRRATRSSRRRPRPPLAPLSAMGPDCSVAMGRSFHACRLSAGSAPQVMRTSSAEHRRLRSERLRPSRCPGCLWSPFFTGGEKGSETRGLATSPARRPAAAAAARALISKAGPGVAVWRGKLLRDSCKVAQGATTQSGASCRNPGNPQAGNTERYNGTGPRVHSSRQPEPAASPEKVGPTLLTSLEGQRSDAWEFSPISVLIRPQPPEH